MPGTILDTGIIAMHKTKKFLKIRSLMKLPLQHRKKYYISRIYSILEVINATEKKQDWEIRSVRGNIYHFKYGDQETVAETITSAET